MKNKKYSNKVIKIVDKIIDVLDENNEFIVDISYRGGKIGVDSDTFLAKLLDVGLDFYSELYNLPKRIGVYRNYLGGGIRSGINRSEYYKVKDKKLIDIIEYFLDRLETRYKILEQEAGIPNDIMEGIIALD